MYLHVTNTVLVLININYGSDFRTVRAGTEESVGPALLHVPRALQDRERECKQTLVRRCYIDRNVRDELIFKNGFPWEREDGPQPEVVLR
jgi:hypothetical protein